MAASFNHQLTTVNIDRALCLCLQWASPRTGTSVYGQHGQIWAIMRNPPFTMPFTQCLPKKDGIIGKQHIVHVFRIRTDARTGDSRNANRGCCGFQLLTRATTLQSSPSCGGRAKTRNPRFCGIHRNPPKWPKSAGIYRTPTEETKTSKPRKL